MFDIVILTRKPKKSSAPQARKLFGQITLVEARPFQKKKKANITIVQALDSAAGAKILGPKLQSHPYRKNQNHKSTGPTQAQKYKPEITIVPFRR